jgi:hypothetical protein
MLGTEPKTDRGQECKNVLLAWAGDASGGQRVSHSPRLEGTDPAQL